MLRASVVATLSAAAMCAAAGCGAASAGPAPNTAAPGSRRAEAARLRSYLDAVEPLRLGVNRLLAGADPILDAHRSGRLGDAGAGQGIGRLERRFAAYAVQVGALRPGSSRLQQLNARYAHTYVLEDAYLSALANGLAEHRLGDLPDTSVAQREAIVAWRIGLEVLAREAGVQLPGDLAQAGRGEIRPSPTGGS